MVDLLPGTRRIYCFKLPERQLKSGRITTPSRYDMARQGNDSGGQLTTSYMPFATFLIREDGRGGEVSHVNSLSEDNREMALHLTLF
jgi:hypothetical protein